METCAMESCAATTQLVQAAYRSDEPVVLLDGADECLIAMTPSVFERILFDSHLLNGAERDITM